MPQSVCVCCPVPTSKPLVMYMSTEHRPWASFGGSLPERRSPIWVKTGGSATMLKEATSELVKLVHVYTNPDSFQFRIEIDPC